MSADPRPRFTLVCAVRDQSTALPAFIAAVEGQDLAASDVQLVAVDCGSVDDTLEQLRSWAARRPELVYVVEAPGSSIGAARNAGLAVTRGEWVSFPAPRDGFERDYLSRVLDFATAHEEAVLISTNRLIADQGGVNVTASHSLRLFHRGDRPLDLERVPEVIVGDPTSTFFRTDQVRRDEVTFDELWSSAPEPYSFAWRLLLRAERPVVGLMRSAKYHQRRGVPVTATPQSLSAAGAPAPPVAGVGVDPTLGMLRACYLATLDEADTHPGGAPEWLRHQMVHGLAHFYVTNDSRPPLGVPLDTEDRDAFHDLAAQILTRVDAENTLPYTMSRIRRLARYTMMFGYRETPWREPFALMGRLDDEQHLVRVTYHFTGPAPVEEFRINGEPVSPVHAKTRQLHYTGRLLLSQRIAWLPFRGMMELRLDAKNVDLEFEYRPFPRRRVTQGVAGWFLRPDTSRVLVPARRAIPPVAESKEGRKAQRLARRQRWRRRFADAWVLLDRLHDAGDNGEALFKHLRRHEPGINAWFVLEKGSPHWERLVSEGFEDRMVPHGSMEWRVLMMHCAHLLSSHADLAVTAPVEIAEIRHLDWRFTFLQHGVIMFDLSNWLNAKRLDTLVTSTQGEYHSIAGEDSQYVVTTREASLTGLPRWDRLAQMDHDHPPATRDLVLVAPTWRKWLLPPIVPGSQRRPLDLSALETQFFRSWKAFVTDERLEKVAREHGLRVGFIPHPNLQPLLPHLGLPPHVQALTYADNDIQQLLSRSRVLVTDYSSIAFDAAYINRPVTYFQFDTEQMLEGSHVGSRGYFDFWRDGFGPVATTLDDAVAEVQRVVEAGPEPLPEYAARMTTTFADRDGGCCARVVDAVRRSTRRADDAAATPTPAPSRPWR